ncbi:STAS domain-containing protein [Bacillus massiliglaciei]|uniref:STAS domain-containing protein n=1 Tax=Bacillus massiliglaciei TaxID=1816693 RepID=UPI000AB6026D|nr:STAS domain-containing protein [Bacillus massiliglaciei]
MFTFEIQPSHEDGAVIVQLYGDLDIDATEIMYDSILPSLDRFQKITIVMANVPFVDSTGIGLLISLIDSMKTKEPPADISISCVDQQVKQIFEIMQFSEIVGEDIFKNSIK